MAKSKSAAASVEELDVYIKLTTGRVIPLKVNSSTTIASVCAQLRGHESSVPSARVGLKYQGKVLNKSKTVGEYGVCKETVLRVEIIPSRALNIFIKVESEKAGSRSIPLAVESTTTVTELKDKIKLLEDVDPCRQTIKHGSRVLSTGLLSLDEFGVDDESVLTLTVGSVAASSSSSVLPKKGNEELNEDEKQDVLASFAASFGADQVVDVVFSFDTTGSMYSCLAEVRQQVGDTVERLLQDIPNIQIGIIAHGDYCDQDSTYVIKQLDLTSKTKEIVKFVRDVPSTGGGDCPECYEWVLVKAQALSWRENSAKALIVIGDALPHQAAYTDRDISWREELATLTDMGVKVYGVQALNQSNSIPFYKELARYSGGKYLKFANFKLITDMFLAVCYGASCPQQLQAYQLEVETEGRMTEELGKVFEELHKETEEADDAKVKRNEEEVVAGDDGPAMASKKALSLDDDYSSPNAVHQAWWSRQNDQAKTTSYTYDEKTDRFRKAKNGAPKSSSSSSSSSSWSSSSHTPTVKLPPAVSSTARKSGRRWSLRKRRTPTISAPIKRTRCSDIAMCRDEFHVGVLGAAGSGKSSLIMQYTGRKFKPDDHPTFTDSVSMQLTHNGRPSLIEIFDSTTSEASIGKCLRNAESFVVVYSVSDQDSFERAEALCRRVREFHGRTDMPITLVANKCDIAAGKHAVSADERARLVREMNCSFLETSATNFNKVERVFLAALSNASLARDTMGGAAPKRRPSFIQRLRTRA